MIKEVLGFADLTFWAEASLVLFGVIFVAVSIRTLRGDRGTALRHAKLVLSEDEGGRHE